MSRYLVVLIGLAVLLTSVGCATRGLLPTEHVTNVNLERKNFEIVQTNVIGTDTGFVLFDLFKFGIPINPCSLTEAMKDMYESARITTGEPVALANVAKEYRYFNLILFSLPRVAIRADVIKFTE